MSTIVSGGYGLPEEGSLVTGGLGATEPAPAGAIYAALSGSGTLAATISSTGAAEQYPGYGPDVAFRPRRRPQVVVGSMEANLRGGSALTANGGTFDWAPITELNNLLLLELV